jgi:hypothetical protein
MAQSTIVVHPSLGQNYGPGKEPEAVRAAWDRHLQAQPLATAEAELEAEIG